MLKKILKLALSVRRWFVKSSNIRLLDVGLNDVLHDGVLNYISGFKQGKKFKQELEQDFIQEVVKIREYVYNKAGISFEAVDFIVHHLQNKQLINSNQQILDLNIHHLNLVYRQSFLSSNNKSSWVERVARSRAVVLESPSILA